MKQLKKAFVSAVILAAGDSRRFGGGKQFLKLFGKTVIERSIEVFEKASLYDEIVIVCKQEDVFAIRDIAASMRPKKLKTIVPGGKTRSESALCGINAVSSKCEYIAFHDGARPLLTPEAADRVVNDAFEHKAAILAVPVGDTIKVSQDGFVKDTPDRKKLYAAQTPQVFLYNEYCFALKEAIMTGAELTDDSQIFERLKKQVYLSEGERDNIKITYPEDEDFARSVLKRRGETI